MTKEGLHYMSFQMILANAGHKYSEKHFKGNYNRYMSVACGAEAAVQDLATIQTELSTFRDYDQAFVKLMTASEY